MRVVRSSIALFAVGVALALPARAQEGPPPAPSEAPSRDDAAPDDAAPDEAPDEAPPMLVPPPIAEPDDSDDDDDDPLPDADEVDDDAGGASWGAATVGAMSACVPTVGTGIGGAVLLTFLSSSLAQTGVTGACLAGLGVGGGLIIGVPSVLALGPCGSGGALLGGLLGAAVDDRTLEPVIVGALPGIGLGVLGMAGATWGLLLLSTTTDDYVAPATILGISAAVSLLATPVTVGGIAVADAVAGGPAPDEDDFDADDGFENEEEDEADGIFHAAHRGRMRY